MTDGYLDYLERVHEYERKKELLLDIYLERVFSNKLAKRN